MKDTFKPVVVGMVILAGILFGVVRASSEAEYEAAFEEEAPGDEPMEVAPQQALSHCREQRLRNLTVLICTVNGKEILRVVVDRGHMNVVQ